MDKNLMESFNLKVFGRAASIYTAYSACDNSKFMIIHDFYRNIVLGSQEKEVEMDICISLFTSLDSNIISPYQDIVIHTSSDMMDNIYG